MGTKWFQMLTFGAYGDESTGERIAESHYYVYGGWLGRVETWTAFESDWKAALRREGLAKFEGAAHAWKPEITSRFVDVILAHRVYGQVAAWPLSPFRRLRGAIVSIFGQKKMHDPHTEAFRAFLQMTAMRMEELPTDDQIAFLLHRHTNGPKCVRLFDQIKQNVADSWVSRLGTITPGGNDEQFVQLQAADLLCYEAWRGRELQNREPVREPLEKLLDSGMLHVPVLNNALFRQLLSAGRAAQRTIT